MRSAAVGIGKITTHFIEVSCLHVTTAGKAEDSIIFELFNLSHHTFLRVSTLGLPFFPLDILLCERSRVFRQGVPLNQQSSTNPCLAEGL